MLDETVGSEKWLPPAGYPFRKARADWKAPNLGLLPCSPSAEKQGHSAKKESATHKVKCEDSMENSISY